MSASPVAASTSPDLSLLLGYASRLEGLLDATKSRSVEGSNILVEEAIKGVLEVLNNVGQVQGHLIEESVAHVKSKLKEKLEEFIKVDPDNEAYYKGLAQRLESHQKHQSSASGSNSSFVKNEASGSDILQELNDIEEKFGNLTEDEIQCLFCFGLFPQGCEIEKTVLVYWWVALDLIDLAGTDELLATLTKEGFIQRTVKNHKLTNSYRMPAGIHELVIEQAVTESWSPKAAVLQKDGILSTDNKKLNPDKVELLLNVGKHTLDATSTTVEWFNGMKNVKVAHLGSWHQDTEYYIVLEDPNFLKILKQMGHLRLLSLQGVSGIVELPDLVYELGNLRVLDLRACHNLEVLPKGIESLQQLTHLDLSECYLLDHIPKGIASLSGLRVLKGFIVSTQNDSSSCAFSLLSALRQLIKLTIRSRRMNFPTENDVRTIREMSSLRKLRIGWTGSISDAPTFRDLKTFPENLEKLELRAAPKTTASQLLRLIREQHNCLRKIYIIGGEFDDLGSAGHCFPGITNVRLRYLPNLYLNWYQCRRTFPNLDCLDTVGSPNLTDIPCDQNREWKRNPFG